jgi:putative peptide maturation dehydrogenase
MASVRRTRYVFFYVDDQLGVDIAALLGGELRRTGETRIVALALLTGERHPLTSAQFELLRSVPADTWVDAHADGVEDLAEMGLLISDSADERLAALYERDRALSSNEWNLYAALYHYMTQWSDVDIRNSDDDELHFAARSKAAVEAFVAEHGPPPGPFAEPPPTRPLQLPLAEPDGAFYRTLTARQTTRAFDPDLPMTLDELSTVLRYVFGCHGYRSTVKDVVCIKRTSPSGGALHPIEAYPIISHVEGVPSGIYHYGVGDHSLSPISELDPPQAREMVSAFLCGQTYFAAAHVCFILTARFYRNHWKYRRHPRAYAGILMDAAHLAQTLYLVSTEMGLGAFVTIGINARDIERRLELDGVNEGVIAVCGCGRRASGRSPLEFQASAQPSR